MIPPRIRGALKGWFGVAIASLLLFTPCSLFAQRGHVANGGPVAAPRISAPPPRVAPPRVASPPIVVAHPIVQTPAVSRPVTSRFIPRIAAPHRVTAVPVFGSGIDPRIGSFAGSLSFRNRRRIFPRPPRFIPVFYPVPVFGFGFGSFGYGLGPCSPYWGWSADCLSAPFGSDFFEPWYGPVEPDYIPVPPDSSTAGDQDEVVLYLKDGTIFVISNYWLQDNKLHYLTSDGRDNSVDMDDVDLQMTVNVNAKRGVTFTLRAAPSGASSGNGGPPPENSPEGQQTGGSVQ